MVKKCNYKYKEKCFKTKAAKGNYVDYEKVIKEKQKVSKSLIKQLRGYQKSWIGK